MRYILALALVACGSPFTSRIGPDDGGALESGGGEEGISTRDALSDSRHDTGHHDADHSDADHSDAVTTSDAGTSDDSLSPPTDAGHDTVPGCDASASTYETIIAAGPRSGMEFSFPTPAACACAGIYDCNCLQTVSNICQGAGTPVIADCTPTTGNRMLITCTGP